MKRLFLLPATKSVLRFSLDSCPDTTIVVALTRMAPRNDLRGALLVTQDYVPESEKHLSAVGAELLKKTFVEAYKIQLKGSDLLASVSIEGVGMLQLWRDGFVGDWNLGHGRVTLRISHDGPGMRLLSDGTQE